MSAVFSARFLRSILKIQSPEEARRFLRLDKYWRADVVERLLKRADDLVALNPKQALGLAEIALEIATKRMRNSPRELQAHAYCSFATALRTCGRLEEAGLNFRKAEEFAKPASSLALNAMIARQKAVLLAEQGDLDRAVKTAKTAVSLDRSAGVFPEKSLIGEGIVLALREEFEESARCFAEVLREGDPTTDSYVFALNNYVASTMHRPILAKEVVSLRESLHQVLERIKGLRGTSIRPRVWYAEGLLHSALAEYGFAIKHFIQARNGFLRLEMMPDFARVTIDLVDVLVKKGDLEKARNMIEGTAQQISKFEEHTRYAEAFRLALDQPLAEVAEFLRARIASGGAVDSGSEEGPDGAD